MKDPYFRTTLVPIVLVLVCPPLVILLWSTVVSLDGSVARLLAPGGFAAVRRALPSPSFEGLVLAGAFVGVQLTLLLLLPGRVQSGAVTPQGNQPTYRLNGVPALFVTHGLFWLGVWAGLYPATIVYDRFGSLLVTLCMFALVFCAFLHWKGRHFPSSSDTTLTGNPIFDYFQGVELHPRFFGVDLKQLCNCRLAMMGWGIIIVSFAAKQRELFGTVSPGMAVAVALQLAYVLKFFAWEGGYFSSLDITHDRFGFYLCWGVLCWLPCVYPIATLYLVRHPAQMSWPAALVLLLFGLGALALNYAVDLQRQRVRTHGEIARVWGKPPRLIVARYRTHEGKERSNVLLASGYWGLSRHFHYVPELALALAWTLPVGSTRALPYFYVLFLAILLVDRAGRDDRRCALKYGLAWAEYRRRVPYKILPGIY